MRGIRFAKGMIAWAVWSVAATASGDDFLVQTRVFDGDSTQAASENTTIFRAGLVYDFMTAPKEITVFDPSHGRFVLLDPQRKLKTEVTTEEIQAFSNKLRDQARASKEKFLNFMADPQFTEKMEDHADAEGQDLSLTSIWLSYQVETAAAGSPEKSKLYADFCDWYAQLNALVNRGALPPFGRMALNEALKKHEQLPKRVQLVLFPQQPVSKQFKRRTEHRWQVRLIDADLRKIEEAGKHLATFKHVELNDYYRPSEPTAK